jgi:hypothetical protein
MLTANYSSIPEIQGNHSSGVLYWLIHIVSVIAGIWIYKSITDPERSYKDSTETLKGA